MRRIGFVLVAVALGVSLASCSNTVTPEDFKKELVTNGLPEKDAQCIIDGIKAKGVTIKRYTELSAQDMTTLQSVATECGMKSAGLDPSSLTVPSVSLPK